MLTPFKHRVYLINALNTERVPLNLSTLCALELQYVKDNSESRAVPGLTCCIGVPVF
jgi:hypothetical protein